jgi:shikimate kinase
MAPGGQVIHLIGPGGAGKSTVGPLLAALLHLPFRDLDAHFAARVGNIDAYMAAHGYRGYACANVDAYLALTEAQPEGVLALSSGFMTYPADVHPAYARVREAIVRSACSITLLPSLDLETCVAEIVRRQVRRGPGTTTAERAEAKIRARFPVYAGLPLPIVTTLRPPSDIATELATRLAAHAPPRHLTRR